MIKTVHFTHYDSFLKIMKSQQFLMSNIKSESYKERQRECQLSMDQFAKIL